MAGVMDIQTLVIDNGTDRSMVSNNKTLTISALFIVLLFSGYSNTCFFRLGLLGMMLQGLFLKV